MTKVLVSLIVTLAFGSVASAAPAKQAAPEPPELVTLREGYKTEMAPIRAKMEEEIKARAARYAADLRKIEDQAASQNRFEAVPILRAEREAFAAGNSTSGFSDEKKVPSAALELRRTFDRDTAKIRSEIAPAARPLLNDYLKKLEALERQFIAAKLADAVLAVREERQSLQGAGADPLSGANALVLGKWADEKGAEITFTADGKVTGGKWDWTERSRRALKIKWNAGPKYWIDLVISPDGSQMHGVNSNGGTRDFKKVR